MFNKSMASMKPAGVAHAHGPSFVRPVLLAPWSWRAADVTGCPRPFAENLGVSAFPQRTSQKYVLAPKANVEADSKSRLKVLL